MAEQIAEKFIGALNQLESGGDLEPIVSLFGDNCEVGNITLSHSFKGIDGAREFWTNYRKTFDEVNSDFKNKIISNGTAALEWTTRGSSENGSKIEYDGVSILETDGGKITRFFAYFNPGELGSQIDEK